MNAYLGLVFAIATEVGATTALRMAVDRNKWWNLAAAIGYIVSFALLAHTLANGMPLGVAYGIWSASGVAIAAVISRFVFKEPLTLVMSVGIALIALGVILIEVGGSH